MKMSINNNSDDTIIAQIAEPGQTFTAIPVRVVYPAEESWWKRFSTPTSITKL